MEIKHILKRLATPAAVILIGFVARVLPHAPNFVPIGAMALFGGAYMSKKQALTLPIAVMVLSDFVIGFDNLPMRLTVYGSFLLVVLVGFWLKKNPNLKNVILSSLATSVLFFLTTNFAVWTFGNLYLKTPSGLSECFLLAIPFFRNTLLGDFFYTGVFFGGYNLVRSLTHNKQALLNPA